jgi:hypothetical protein
LNFDSSSAVQPMVSLNACTCAQTLLWIRRNLSKGGMRGGGGGGKKVQMVY